MTIASHFFYSISPFGFNATLPEGALPYHDECCQRFLQGFPAFILFKKYQAVRALLAEEIPHEPLASNPDFLKAIVERLGDDVILEKRQEKKRYLFLSLNPKRFNPKQGKCYSPSSTSDCR